jgi:hypothetical protein
MQLDHAFSTGAAGPMTTYIIGNARAPFTAFASLEQDAKLSSDIRLAASHPFAPRNAEGTEEQ